MENIGLIPKIWGPPQWEVLHCITFAYPENPTDEDKDNYRTYFNSVGNVLPCSFCAKSYKEFIKSGSTELTDDVLKNRKNLTKWLYDLHNVVNKKLGITYNVTYEMICNKYESYRSHCNMTANDKIIGYKYSEIKHPPTLLLKYATCFSKYAQERGIKNFDIELSRVSRIKKFSTEWHINNKEILQIIRHMKFKGLTALEHHGKFKRFPTIYELELIKRMSTTLSINEIIDILNKLNFNVVDSYIFSK